MNNLHVHIGVYLKVFFPKEPVVKKVAVCSKCNKRIDSPYCPDCGGRMELREIETLNYSPDGIYEFCNKHYGFGDRFSGVFWKGDYQIVASNEFPDSSLNVSEWTDDRSEFAIPPNEFSPEWVDLMGKLDANGIKYEKCYGIIYYWI